MYLFLFIGIVFLFIGIITFQRGRSYQNQSISEIELKCKEQIAKDLQHEQKELDSFRKIKEDEINGLIRQKDQWQNRAKEARDNTERLLRSEQERLAAEISKQKEVERMKLTLEMGKRREELEALYNTKNADLEQNFTKLRTQQELWYNKKKEELQAEIVTLQSQLDEWKSKQEAINREIQRQQELEDTINFHRIQLKESDKTDIHFLLSIEDNINNKELLHKLIWTEYIQRPFNQMINSTFGSKVPKNVIYCIENINTHKKYIGKTSAEVSKRWIDHIKNSLNIGTIKRQNIHDALYNHWDEFTFTILEEVKDDKLSDREKFYINFFQTDKYGFNIKSGG